MRVNSFASLWFGVGVGVRTSGPLPHLRQRGFEKFFGLGKLRTRAGQHFARELCPCMKPLKLCCNVPGNCQAWEHAPLLHPFN